MSQLRSINKKVNVLIMLTLLKNQPNPLEVNAPKMPYSPSWVNP